MARGKIGVSAPRPCQTGVEAELHRNSPNGLALSGPKPVNTTTRSRTKDTDHAPRHSAVIHFLRNNRAAVAIEFGLTAMMFGLVLCFIIELGLTVFMQMTLDQATRVASRLIRTGSIQSAGGSVTPFTTALCTRMSLLMTCSSIQYNVVSGATFSALSTTLTVNSSNKMTGTQFTPGTSGQDVVVQVGYARRLFFPVVSSILSTNGTLLMVSTVAFQNEPY